MTHDKNNISNGSYVSRGLWSTGAFIFAAEPSTRAAKMSLKFTKMHGLGNDFMVIDGVNQKFNLGSAEISKLADRHFGVGFDQCLIVEPSVSTEVDFNYKIYNANGQEVGQCGNGARCLASFIRYKGLSAKKSLAVSTQTTVMRLEIEDDGAVTVDMGKPIFLPSLIPIAFAKQQATYSIPLEFDDLCFVHALSVGNPHAVLVVDKLDDDYVQKYGEAISLHKLFPEQVNVSFMQIIDSGHIHLRVYERGCGETKACGSGAVAAAVIGILQYELLSTVLVSLPGGDLQVTWPDLHANVSLNGPTQIVFEGEIDNLCE